MGNPFEKYRGIHPGIVLDRELKKRSIKQRTLALSVGEHPQALNAITKGKRGISVALALKIEKELGMEEGALAVLQTWYDIKIVKEKEGQKTPDFSILRKSLFWDTDPDRIDWDKQFRAVVFRVFDRGNNAEQEEVTRFYGIEKVKSVLDSKHLTVDPWLK